MTPENFLKEHGSLSFNFEEIEKKFKSICSDYKEPLEMDKPSMSLDFASKVIYTIGPESRQVKRRDNDKTWKFVFIYRNKDVLFPRVAFVSTFKNEQPNVDVNDSTKISLSVKVASLLAIDSINRLNKLWVADTKGGAMEFLLRGMGVN